VTTQHPPAVVLGCGVSGLTTALCLAEAGHPVRVWAADPPQHTTSVVASALWGPLLAGSGPRTMAWSERSLRDFRELAGDPGTGVVMAPVLTVDDELAADEPPAAAALIPDLRPCEPGRLPAGLGPGFRSTMPLIDMPPYLDHLAARLSALDVGIETRAVSSLAEAADEAPIVVNCTGLGARDLVDDHGMTPVFGQHAVLSNPGIDEVFLGRTLADEWTAYFPHCERVVCGGIRVPGRWDTAPDPDLTDRILRRCREVEPRLHDAELREVVTGLRPHRTTVRLEAEALGAALCVHNYGHGSNGVTLSWGCAREVVALARTAPGTYSDALPCQVLRTSE
jgi:D-amino-acid oxidase